MLGRIRSAVQIGLTSVHAWLKHHPLKSLIGWAVFLSVAFVPHGLERVESGEPVMSVALEVLFILLVFIPFMHFASLGTIYIVMKMQRFRD